MVCRSGIPESGPARRHRCRWRPRRTRAHHSLFERQCAGKQKQFGDQAAWQDQATRPGGWQGWPWRPPKGRES